MKSRLIATVTAATLAFTSALATPVFADDRSKDALKVLLGAAAIGLVINEVNKNKRKKEQQQAAQTRRHDEWQDERWKRPSKYGHRNRWIPAECVFSIRGDDRRRGHDRRSDVVSARCLNEYGINRRIPERCAFDINTRWGNRTVYGARCLRDHGFKIADGRR